MRGSLPPYTGSTGTSKPKTEYHAPANDSRIQAPDKIARCFFRANPPALHDVLINWCLSHWRGSALGFPRGEAVAKIGASEPILVTDEEWRNLPITGAVRKKAPYWNTVCPLEAHMFLHLPPFLIHRFAVPLPPGGRYLLSASGFQTPICRCTTGRWNQGISVDCPEYVMHLPPARTAKSIFRTCKRKFRNRILLSRFLAH